MNTIEKVIDELRKMLMIFGIISILSCVVCGSLPILFVILKNLNTDVGRINDFQPMMYGQAIPGTDYVFKENRSKVSQSMHGESVVLLQSKTGQEIQLGDIELRDTFMFGEDSYAVLDYSQRRYVIIEKGARTSDGVNFYFVYDVTDETPLYVGQQPSCIRPRLEDDKLEFEYDSKADCEWYGIGGTSYSAMYVALR